MRVLREPASAKRAAPRPLSEQCVQEAAWSGVAGGGSASREGSQAAHGSVPGQLAGFVWRAAAPDRGPTGEQESDAGDEAMLVTTCKAGPGLMRGNAPEE